MARFQEAWKQLSLSGAPLPFVLIDAAGLERGLAAVPRQIFSEFDCLFSGDRADEMRDVAPYLGQLASGDDSSQQVLSALVDSEAAILVVPSDATLTFQQLYRHLRQFNIAYGPDGNPIYLRYYDPRVLPDVLRVLEPGQLERFFGPIETLLVVGGDHQLRRYFRHDEKLEIQG